MDDLNHLGPKYIITENQSHWSRCSMGCAWARKYLLVQGAVNKLAWHMVTVATKIHHFIHVTSSDISFNILSATAADGLS